MQLFKEILSIDCEKIKSIIQDFIFNSVKSANADGVIIGLSGGIDSSVTAFLAVNALGSDNVLGLILTDSNVTPKQDIQDGRRVVDELSIESKEVDISGIHDKFLDYVPKNRVSEGNLRARIRMCIMYYYANLLNRLVVGTGDKSEALLGYFTKYGDGGADMLPIFGLYKSQVKLLGKHLNIPSTIVEKKSSPRLWIGQEAEEELGMTYGEIDSIFHMVFDHSISTVDVADSLNMDLKRVETLLDKYSSSSHKRIFPNSCNISSV